MFNGFPNSMGLKNLEGTNRELLEPHQGVSEPNENSSIPIIVADEFQFELGDDITFFFGMRDGINYIEGYNYTIYLELGQVNLSNDTSILANFTQISAGITKNVVEVLSIKSIGQQSPISTAPNNYTLMLVVNSTNRGILNATSNFEIIIPPGADVKHRFKTATQDPLDNDEIRLNVNETIQISIVLQNLGDTNAFNITLIRDEINEPIGFANFTLPDIVSILAPLEEVHFNFTVTPTDFGIGELSFNLDYTDGLGNVAGSTPILRVLTLPNLRGAFLGSGPSVEIEYTEGTEIPINVFFNYIDTLPLNSISISIVLTSERISFPQNEIPYELGRSTYVFSGTPIGPGEADIIMWAKIFDNVGPDIEEYILDTTSFNLTIDPISTSDGTNFSEYLPGIAIFLYFVLISSLAILYYREDIRTKFFTNVLGLQLINRIDYKTNSIVIDGSNIAWEQTNESNKPMIDNIIKAYKSLKENGFTQIVIIADAALRYQIDDKDELDRLIKTRFIKLVPAKVNADGFILRFSAENGYLILSNDLYKEYREEYDWIDERRVPYTILDETFYLHPTFE
jgi:hypothetical protein